MEKPTNDLLFGSNQQKTVPITLVVSRELRITDLSDSAVSFFKKPKNLIINSPLLDQLLDLNLNKDPLVTIINSNNTALIQTVELTHNSNRKNYFVTITNLFKNDADRYIFNISPVNNSFELLTSYVNSIINNLPGAVYWKDLDGKYMGCNKFVATMAGYDNPEKMIGKTDYDLCWKEFADEWRTLDNKVINDNQTLTREEHAKLSNGNTITELTFKTPLKNEYDEIIGVIGTSLDITELKKAQAALMTAKETAELALQAMKQAQIEEQKHREEAERLAIENAKHKAELEAQAAFTSTIDKAAHDIGSPMSGLVTTMECLGGLEDVTTIDGYSVALISEPERQKNTLYLRKKDSGLDFEVLGKDDALEKGHILWDDILIELKKNTLGDASDVPVFQKEYLGILLNILINKDLIKAGMGFTAYPAQFGNESTMA